MGMAGRRYSDRQSSIDNITDMKLVSSTHSDCSNDWHFLSDYSLHERSAEPKRVDVTPKGVTPFSLATICFCKWFTLCVVASSVLSSYGKNLDAGLDFFLIVGACLVFALASWVHHCLIFPCVWGAVSLKRCSAGETKLGDFAIVLETKNVHLGCSLLKVNRDRSLTVSAVSFVPVFLGVRCIKFLFWQVQPTLDKLVESFGEGGALWFMAWSVLRTLLAIPTHLPTKSVSSFAVVYHDVGANAAKKENSAVFCAPMSVCVVVFTFFTRPAIN